MQQPVHVLEEHVIEDCNKSNMHGFEGHYSKIHKPQVKERDSEVLVQDTVTFQEWELSQTNLLFTL